MNLIHNWLCQSDGWRNALERRIPWALQNLELESDLLEIGPGFGVATDVVQPLADRLTCVEIDRRFARKLRNRMAATTSRSTLMRRPSASGRENRPQGNAEKESTCLSRKLICRVALS